MQSLIHESSGQQSILTLGNVGQVPGTTGELFFPGITGMIQYQAGYSTVMGDQCISIN